MLSIIAVIGKNRELGKSNKLLWHVPGDLPRFKQITSGHPVIMGKNTYLSIGKPLKDRTNIVLSKELTSQEGITVVPSIADALDFASGSPGSEEVFIIGGGKIYAQTIDRADRLYLTIVNAAADADTYFPDYSQFKTVIASDQKTSESLSFRYVTLER